MISSHWIPMNSIWFQCDTPPIIHVAKFDRSLHEPVTEDYVKRCRNGALQVLRFSKRCTSRSLNRFGGSDCWISRDLHRQTAPLDRNRAFTMSCSLKAFASAHCEYQLLEFEAKCTLVESSLKSLCPATFAERFSTRKCQEGLSLRDSLTVRGHHRLEISEHPVVRSRSSRVLVTHSNVILAANLFVRQF